MSLCTKIIVKTQFAALHCWPGCPHEDVSFLRNPHRHMFFVEVKAVVTHADRDLEFILVKKELDSFLSRYPYDLGSKSCEMICGEILDYFPQLTYVKVMEDNENGAEIER